MELNEKSDEELKKIMISLCIIWDTDMKNPKQLSRLEMIDRIEERQNEIAYYQEDLENDTLSNYSQMVGIRLPVLVIIDIVRYAWEMDTMNGRYKYRVCGPYDKDVLVGRYKWALSLGLVCKRFFNLVRSSLFKRVNLYSFSIGTHDGPYDDRKARSHADDASRHINNIACAMKQPTHLSLQCTLLIGIALKPSIGAVIFLQGITKLRLVGRTLSYNNLLQSALGVMVNLESLVLYNTEDILSGVYQPSLKHLSFLDHLKEGGPMVVLDEFTNPIQTLGLPGKHNLPIQLPINIASQIKKLRIPSHNIPPDFASNYTSLWKLHLTNIGYYGTKNILSTTMDNITYLAAEITNPIHRKEYFEEIIPHLPSLTILEDYRHNYCKDECHIFCNNLLKLNNNNQNNNNNNNDGMVNGIKTIILRSPFFNRNNFKHSLARAGLSNYKATGQRFIKHEFSFDIKIVFSYTRKLPMVTGQSKKIKFIFTKDSKVLDQ
ncbi:hypothetical protein DFA_01576 [Cavenderia fasciculata]|uniref:Uncharacterized protein n=1 Tax=Cavenderia fasciculata TaxID=261658 RepID=F4PTM0_CACFS|nr:uncharacterized protein DFA_01576 [Cavenderia fasciculata]EGG21690.1 hypothetical protein DFA_01576 [Cavenderia fasciculata]|eukprot:XP_004359540.1 hypothetical protein DFA_01576 [Cavenderia fasciculata]